MDFSFTQSQDELSALCRKILTDKVTPQRLTEIEPAGERLDPVLWATLAESGVLAAALPEAAGGAGLGLAEQCTVLVELGRALAPAPYLESIVLGAGLLAEFGSPAQVARWAAPAAAGEMIITAALAEPGTDDPARSSVLAEPAAGGWSLTGVKTAVPAGVAARMFLVTARRAAGGRAGAGTGREAGTAVYAVERSDPGVTVRPQWLTGGQGPAELELDAVQLDDGRLVGPADGGAAVRWLVDRATLGLCARQLGVAERALELTASYARNREQFGRPIGGFQAVAHRLADAYVDVTGIRLTMWQAAWRLQAGLPCAAEIATAKFWAADAGHRVAHTAVHVHGGVGVDASHLLHRYFTAAKENEFALGGGTAQLRRIGAMLAGPG